MPRTINAALLLLFSLLLPAAAGAFCVRVEVDGRPLPSGFVTLTSGPSGRSLARLRDGRACLDGAAPGDYRLKVSPLNWLRLSVKNDGRFVLRDAKGRIEREGAELALIERPLDQTAASMLEARVLFEANPSTEASRPALLAVHLLPGRAGDAVAATSDAYRFTWLEPRPEGGERAARLAVPAGRLQRLELHGPGWTTLSASWDYAGETSSTQTVTALLHAGPGVLISGRVRYPDGSPFKPSFGGRAEDLSALSVEFIDLLDAGTAALVDENGGYELRAAPGAWIISTRYRGTRAFTGVDELLFAVVPASSTFSFDVPVVLRDAALRITPEHAPVGAFESIVPLRSRGPGEPGFCDTSERRLVEIYLRRDGRWTSHPLSDLTNLAPGRYDLYRLSNRSAAGMTVEGSLRDVGLERGKITNIEVLRTERAPRVAELGGRIVAPPLASPADLRAARSPQEFCELLLPSVTVFAVDGRPLAFAGALQTPAALSRILDALSGGRDDDLRTLLAPAFWVFRVTDLPPTRVRAVFKAGKLPPKSVELDLSRPLAPLVVDFRAVR